MTKIEVFIDSSVFIAWLKQESQYDDIEKIRELAEKDIIEISCSLDIILEIIKGDDGSSDWEKIQNSFKPKIHYMTPNVVIGDKNGSYKKYLVKSCKKWDSLKNSIKEVKDTKHYITANMLAEADYFLAIDKKFFSKMKNRILQKTKCVTPSKLIEMLN